MIPVRIEGANAILGKDQDGVKALHVRLDPTAKTISSAWQPSPAEQRAIAAGASVRLSIMGTAHPPVWLDVGQRPEPVSSLAPADCPLCRSARAHEAPRATTVTHISAGPNPDALARAESALKIATKALQRVADGKPAFAHNTTLLILIRDMKIALEGIR